MSNISPYNRTEVAVYKGDELLVMDTIPECANKLGVRRETITFYMTPTYLRRLAARGPRANAANQRRVVRV